MRGGALAPSLVGTPSTVVEIEAEGTSAPGGRAGATDTVMPLTLTLAFLTGVPVSAATTWTTSVAVPVGSGRALALCRSSPGGRPPAPRMVGEASAQNAAANPRTARTRGMIVGAHVPRIAASMARHDTPGPPRPQEDWLVPSCGAGPSTLLRAAPSTVEGRLASGRVAPVTWPRVLEEHHGSSSGG